MAIEYIFAYSSMGSVLLPLGIAALQFNRLKGSSLYMFYLLSGSLLSDLASYYVGKISGNTYWIANVYLLFQFLTLSKIYFHELKKPSYLIFIAAIFTLFFFINTVFVQGFFVFDTHSNSLSGLILVSISLYFLFNLLKNLPDSNIYNIPMFWISFAVLFYCGGTLILFLTNNFFVNKFPNSLGLVWTLHNFCNIVKNLLFAIALWHNYRNLKQSS